MHKPNKFAHNYHLRTCEAIHAYRCKLIHPYRRERNLRFRLICVVSFIFNRINIDIPLHASLVNRLSLAQRMYEPAAKILRYIHFCMKTTPNACFHTQTQLYNTYTSHTHTQTSCQSPWCTARNTVALEKSTFQNVEFSCCLSSPTNEFTCMCVHSFIICMVFGVPCNRCTIPTGQKLDNN